MVRRWGWLDRWLFHHSGVWFIVFNFGRLRVVRCTDFGRGEFLARDYTTSWPDQTACILATDPETPVPDPPPPGSPRPTIQTWYPGGFSQTVGPGQSLFSAYVTNPPSGSPGKRWMFFPMMRLFPIGCRVKYFSAQGRDSASRILPGGNLASHIGMARPGAGVVPTEMAFTIVSNEISPGVFRLDYSEINGSADRFVAACLLPENARIDEAGGLTDRIPAGGVVTSDYEL